MEPTYENIVTFMDNYFKDFCEYAQDPQTVHKMNHYFAPDFEFVPYIAELARISGYEEFLRLISAHPSSFEKLTTEDIMVDERRMVAVVLIKAEIIERATGKVLVTKRYHPLYQLVLSEDESLQIQKILFFEEILPPGTLNVGDVLRRDPGIANLFSDRD